MSIYHYCLHQICVAHWKSAQSNFNIHLTTTIMTPQRSTKAQRSTSLRQGTLSFASAKRSGSSGAKDSLKGKTAATSIEHPIVPIRIGGKRKYEPDPEPEQEEAKEPTEVLERERLNTEDPRWNKAFGQARAKMGNIKPGPSFAPRSLFVLS